jgi:hypothetical protein
LALSMDRDFAGLRSDITALAGCNSSGLRGSRYQRGLRLQLVAGGVTDIEDVHGILADGENDAVLRYPLTPPAVAQFMDGFGEFVAFAGERAPLGPDLQRFDGLIEPGQPFVGGAICSRVAIGPGRECLPWRSRSARCGRS